MLFEVIKAGQILARAANEKIQEARYHLRPDVIAWKRETRRVEAERERLLREYVESNPERVMKAHRILTVYKIATSPLPFVVAIPAGVLFGSWIPVVGLACFLVLGHASKGVFWWMVIRPANLPELPPQPER